ncbi:alpha/beta hydrolase [uncultured Aquimarina sp.]|uniref:alpha/beta fold hydrolase n=1 Tax=uncultured Aquimarina sp. TaxID=575652 RepID=UPI0026285BFB|nr:alpha/beta hydrolase [uncultured Aquimarina sp.]
MKNEIKITLRLFILLFSAFAIIACSDDDDNTLNEDTDNQLIAQHLANLNFIDVSGNTMAYLDYGPADGEVLLLIHSIPTSSFLYRNVVQQIANQSGYRVIAVDYLGFGQGDKPETAGLYTLTAQANRVYAFTDALGIDDFVLGMHGIGGFIATEMMKQSTAQINGLVIADASAWLEGATPSPTNGLVFSGQATAQEVWSQLADFEFAEFTTNEFLEIGLTNDALITEELLEAYTLPVNNAGTAQAYIDFFETIGIILADPESTDLLFQNFNKPVAIIWGEDDTFFDVNAVAARFEEQFSVPENRITIIPDTGFYIQEEAPTEYINAVVQFLDEAF